MPRPCPAAERPTRSDNSRSKAGLCPRAETRLSSRGSVAGGSYSQVSRPGEYQSSPLRSAAGTVRAERHTAFHRPLRATRSRGADRSPRCLYSQRHQRSRDIFPPRCPETRDKTFAAYQSPLAYHKQYYLLPPCCQPISTLFHMVKLQRKSVDKKPNRCKTISKLRYTEGEAPWKSLPPRWFTTRTLSQSCR